ncbi:MAG: hypothetical protein EA357_03005 [Micavibrio sp.]|nr:MAG: hypothetical protein EA357_03005 [Micavibrio sp.]
MLFRFEKNYNLIVEEITRFGEADKKMRQVLKIIATFCFFGLNIVIIGFCLLDMAGGEFDLALPAFVTYTATLGLACRQKRNNYTAILATFVLVANIFWALALLLLALIADTVTGWMLGIGALAAFFNIGYVSWRLSRPVAY